MARLHPEQIAIRFVESTTTRERRAAAEDCALEHWDRRIELPGEEFLIMGVAASAEPYRTRRARSLTRLARHRHVAEARPVFQRGRTRWLHTSRILVKPRAHGLAEVRRLVRGGGRIVHERHGTILLQLGTGQDLLAEVRRLARMPSIEFVEPDYVVLGHHPGAGSAGARLAVAQLPFRLIRAAEGWKAGVASPDILIAILDCGVMTAHPDLHPAVALTYDATTGRTDQSPPPWDSHGTSCAALAAGAHSRREGVKGVAAGCRLLPVRVGRTPGRLGSYVTKSSWVCRGIDWAWEHGAAVLSMSFGGGPRSAAVTAALRRARTRGRQGKGAVLVASAGNGAGPRAPVEFPATLPWVLAVAATDNKDRPKRAPDNQNPWVSASGPAVDIAAPGVGCYTATVPDPAENELALYISDFSGTSAATPLVAGTAALVIGANPALQEREIRRLLGDTADRVGGLRYQDGRNNQVGSGRLNVGAAIRAARALAGSSPTRDHARIAR